MDPARSPAPRRRSLVLFALPLTLLGLLCRAWREHERESSTTGRPFGDGGENSAKPGAAPRSASPAPACASARELQGQLVRLGEIELTDQAVLEELVRPLLVPPENVFAVLELLRAGDLAQGSGPQGFGLSPAEIGALRLLVLAASSSHTPGIAGELARSCAHVDEHALLVAALRALPDVRPPAQELLLELLRSSCGRGARAARAGGDEPERPAGLDAPLSPENELASLRQEYWRLRVVGGADAATRLRLVAAMEAAPSDELLSIAARDPSSEVRAQAWSTLTEAPGFRPSRAALELLHEGLVNGTDREIGLPDSAVVSAAARCARAAAGGDAALLPEALTILRKVVEDHAPDECIRREAVEALRPYLTGTDYAGLLAGL